MRKLMIVALIALPFATGFTCSKQTPPPTPAEMPAPSQEQMGAPAEQPATPPAEGAPATPPPAEDAGH